jgi:hypothetical protein
MTAIFRPMFSEGLQVGVSGVERLMFEVMASSQR